MLDAVQRSVALRRAGVRKAAYLFKVKRRKYLGDTFVIQEPERPVYFGDLYHPTRVPEIGYASRALTPRQWTVSQWSGRTYTPTEAE
ncbi:hypothetical protein EVAR_55418_1 [Eumeta japonica]|uniref:Uncharacterized protein n=1 Tax=Eumeta variegata TaxID=151549 RepID=A0A4C1Z891_EUMVA|nr:hypothetical protein EVAR_55418_1 [Eumeta japonica]